MHVAQSVPQVRAVPNVKRKVFGTLKCHQDDTGASGRGVSSKLTGLSEQLAGRARPSGKQPEMVLSATAALKGSWCSGGAPKP